MTLLPYDLAKELKDAGWPQPNHKRPRNWGGDFILPPELDPDLDLVSQDAPYSPSLSELIEACGEGFDELYRVHHTEMWGASGGYLTTTKTTRHKTPEIAVARLWLALKKEGKV